MSNTQINIQEFFNKNRFSKFQLLIFILTFLVAFFDGYDTAVIGYIAPSLLGEWGLERKDLAPVLSAALLGLAIGAISFGPVADKVGRKVVLITAVSIFAVGTIISAYATSLLQLEILRFITGVGLGAAMPNAVTLLSEYCPDNKRSVIVNTMYCGFPLGAALGGFISAWLIPAFGWRSTLLFGGLAPLVLVIVMMLMMPESARYLVAKKRPVATIRKIMAKIHPSALQADAFVMTENNVVLDDSKGGIAVVMSRHYRAGSILLWISYFMGLLIFYSVMNWMPVLFREIEMSQGTASIVTGLFALGGLGAIVNGWFMDRFNANKLIALFSLLTAGSVAFIGVTVNMHMALLIAVVIFAGIVMNTAQSSLPALAAAFYPTQGRTTGVSWMLGIGRLGGIAGSFLVAWLVSKEFSLENIFYILGVPALITTVCLLLKQSIYGEQRKSATNTAN